MRMLFAAGLLLALLACGPKRENPDGDAPQSAPAAALPALSVDELNALRTATVQVDLMFDQLGFSINLAEGNTVQFFSQLTAQPAAMSPDCRRFGDAFLQSQTGETRRAELVFGGSCAYYVFYDGSNAPTHANQMSDEGIHFINALISRVNAGE